VRWSRDISCIVVVIVISNIHTTSPTNSSHARPPTPASVVLRLPSTASIALLHRLPDRLLRSLRRPFVTISLTPNHIPALLCQFQPFLRAFCHFYLPLTVRFAQTITFDFRLLRISHNPAAVWLTTFYRVAQNNVERFTFMFILCGTITYRLYLYNWSEKCLQQWSKLIASKTMNE